MAGHIVVDGRTLALPEGDDLTYGELISMERISGLTQAELQDHAQRGSIRAIAALVYVSMRRAGDTVTEQDVLNMRITNTQFVDEKSNGNGASPPDQDSAVSEADAPTESSAPEQPGTQS